MKTFDYDEDYKYAKQLIAGEIGGVFRGIFHCSNENIPKTLSKYNLEDKDILSVAGSGDQIIHALNRGAGNIDVFDICTLPKEYLYLRKWFIKYKHKFYPSIDCLSNNFDELKDLLSKVECFSEQEYSALKFWKRLVDEKLEINKMFVFPIIKKCNFIDDDKIDRFKDFGDFNYYLFDLCSQSELPPKKYDFILASNIIEHCGMDKYRIRFAKDNLYKLLKDNGVVICSQLFTENFDPPRVIQRQIFEEDFIYEDICDDVTLDGKDYVCHPGHSYIKK